MNPDRLLSSPPVRGLGSVLSRRRLVVLAYHGVEDVDSLATQLSWIAERRRAISIAALLDACRSGTALTEPSFLVTFDDGRRSVLERGLPVLESLDVPAALFVVAGLVGSTSPFWWDEARELAGAGGVSSIVPGGGEQLVRDLKQVPDSKRREALEELRSSASEPAPSYQHLRSDELIELEHRGVTIGSHSQSHPCLDRCTTAAIEEELVTSRDELGAMLGHRVAAVAYPNGNYDGRVVAAARSAGYELGFMFDHRLARVPPGDALTISRVRVDTRIPLERFAAIVAGVHPLVHRLRGGK